MGLLNVLGQRRLCEEPHRTLVAEEGVVPLWNERRSLRYEHQRQQTLQCNPDLSNLLQGSDKATFLYFEPTQCGGTSQETPRQAVGHSDVLLQRVDVSKHVWAVVAMKCCDVGELQQREGSRCTYPPSAGAVGFTHMLIEVVERRQGFQAQLTGVALLWLISMDGLQMDLQHSQTVEVSLRAVRTRVGHFGPGPSCCCYKKKESLSVKVLHRKTFLKTDCNTKLNVFHPNLKASVLNT